MLTAVLASRVLGERPTSRQWLGLVLGLTGVAVVVGPGVIASGPAQPLPTVGLIACVVAHFVTAFGYLVLVLSIGAVLLLLLRRGTAAGVSSLYYLVPPATAIEAYLLFGETVGGLSPIGIGVTALGVALVVVPSRGRRADQAGSSPE